MRILRDLRHLWIWLLLMGGIGAGISVRGRMVPASFGEQGPYRTAALTEIAAKTSVFQADAVCHACHQDVEQERAESLHKAVRCTHCHGLCQKHVAQAQQAAKSEDVTVDPASAWDGNFLTDIDLFITRDRKACLACHQAVAGMPEEFRKINPDEHLQEMEAADPTSREVCLECHAGHDTRP